jgi:drug/metabolite transporter (DMT)-like permease
VLLFGVAGLFGKWVAAGALVIVWGRVVFAVPALLLLLWWRGEGLRLPGERWRVMACGLLLAAHWAAFFQGIQVSTVAVGLLGYATAPVMVVLLEPWWFRERYSPAALLAAGASLGGIALLVPRWQLDDATAQGLAWGVLSGALFALLALLNRALVARHDAMRLALYEDGAAALGLTLLLPLVPVSLTWRDAGLLLVLGVFCTALAHTWFIQSMRHLPARTATIVSNLEPVYGIALAMLLLGELPAPRTWAGGALILGGAAWATLRPWQRTAGQQTAGQRTVKPPDAP